MWPFGKKAAARLAAASGGAPVRVSVLTSIVSPAAVVSPFTGMRSALLQVEIVERIPVMASQGPQGDDVSDLYMSLGTVMFGDMLTLRDPDGDELTIVARRAFLAPALPRRGGTPISRVPPEVLPFMQRASGRGIVCYRELTLSEGDTIRVKAFVEPRQSIVSSGYRSGTRVSYVARDDLGEVLLEEIFEAPPW